MPQLFYNYNSQQRSRKHASGSDTFWYKYISASVDGPFLSTAYWKMAVQISKKRKVSTVLSAIYVQIHGVSLEILSGRSESKSVVPIFVRVGSMYPRLAED